MKIYMAAEEVMQLDWKKNPRPLRKHQGGVYRIVDKQSGELLYIGQASDLSNRLTPSIHPIFRRGVHDVFILFENDRDTRLQMEGNFILLLKPKNNIRLGQTPMYSEDDLSSVYHGIFG